MTIPHMDAYDSALVPAPFGLSNTGSICYLNSFLQLLVGCSAFTRSVLANEDIMIKTRTGRAVLDFCRGYSTGDNRLELSLASSRVFAAIYSDLRERRPGCRELSHGQDDPATAFDMLLDMLEERLDDDKDPCCADRENTVTQLFRHRYKVTMKCHGCSHSHSPGDERGTSFRIVALPRMPLPTTAREFASRIRRSAVINEDYSCPGCGKKGFTTTVYNLSTIPEIIFCLFNLHDGHWSHTTPDGKVVVGRAGGDRNCHYFPERLEFPAVGGGVMGFKLVGQAEHSGGNNGGHYWERGLRSGGVFTLNDSGVTASSFAPSPETYMLAYHFSDFS